MITPEGANDTHMGFNTFCIWLKRFTSDSYTCKVLWCGGHVNSIAVVIAIYGVYKSTLLLLVYWQLSDVGMASTRSTVRKVTVVTSTSRHSTRRPHRDHCHPQQPYHARTTLLIHQYGASIVTYFSVVKLWFTLRASASAVAPESPIPFHSRLWKRVLQNLVQVVKTNQWDRFNIGLCHY